MNIPTFLSTPMKKIVGQLVLVTALMSALSVTALAQLPATSGTGNGLRDPNKPNSIYTGETDKVLFNAVFWKGDNANWFDASAWRDSTGNALGAIANDADGASTLASLYNRALPAGFTPGTVIVLGYKTTDGSRVIPDTINVNTPEEIIANAKHYAGDGITRAHINMAYTKSGDFEQRIDQIQYSDLYALNLSGNASGRFTLNLTGQGFVRWFVAAGSAANLGSKIPAGYQAKAIMVNIGAHSTLKYSTSANTINAIDANWSNKFALINLTDATSIFDLSEAMNTTAMNYTYNRLQGVAGSQIIVRRDTTLLIGGADNYSMQLDSNIIQTGTGTKTAALTKEGTGILYLGGANTYEGITTVNGGAVFINGSVAGAVTVAAGTYLGGNAKGKPASYWNVAGAVTVNGSGIISAGSDGGTTGELRIKGNLIQSSAVSWIVADIVSPTDYDKIIVGGNVTLGGGISIVPTSGAVLMPGTYRILEATGSITGTPSKVGTPGFLSIEADVVKGAKYVDVKLTQLNFSDITGLPAYAYQAATAADSLIGVPEAGHIIGTLNGLTGYLPMARALAQLTPIADRYWYANAVATSKDIVTRFNDRLRAPLESEHSKFGVFAAYSMLDNSMPAMDGAESMDATTNRYMGGVDYIPTDNLTLSLFYSKEKTEADTDYVGGKGEVDGNTIGVFADYKINNWKINAMVFYGKDDYESKRSLMFAGAGDYTNSTTEGTRLGLSANVEYTIENVIGGALTPYAGLQYVAWETDAYTENGSTVGMHVGKQDATSIIGSAGVRFVYAFNIKKKVPTRFFANLGYMTQFGDVDHDISATLNGNAYTMKVSGERSGFAFRAGFEADLGRHVTLSFSGGRENGVLHMDTVSYYAGIFCRF